MRLGSLAPVAVVQNTLRDTYNVTVGYAQNVISTLGGASGASITGAPELFALQYSIGALDWNTGSGAGVANGSVDWSTYRDQLTSFIQSVISVGAEAGLDMGMAQAWYQNTAAPALANLTISANVGQTAQGVGQTVGAGMQGAAGEIPWWVWALGVGGVLLYLSSFVPKPTTHVIAGFGSRRRRR